MMEPQWNKHHLFGIIISYIGFCLFICSVLKLYFEHWVILTFIVAFWLIIIVVRAISTYLLYPGSFQFTKASLEIRESQYLYDNNQDISSRLKSIMFRILNTSFQDLRKNSYQLQNNEAIKYIKDNLSFLRRSKNSQIKNQLKKLYKNLDQQFQTSFTGQQTKFCDILCNSRIFKNLNQEPHYVILRKIAEKSIQTIKQIQKLQTKLVYPQFKTTSSKSNLTEAMVSKWILNGEKLFELDSFYGYWDQYYNYSKFEIKLSSNQFIQCAIIHSFLSNQEQKMNTNKAVLFSCPNAVYMQIYGVQNGYIQFYLNLGFQVILWNYRGYGNSTGSPSISKCAKDVEQVYQHCKKFYNANIVIAHGYSIGAVCAIRLGNKYGQQIRLVIADRTFADIQKTATQFIPENSFLFSCLKKISKYIIHFFLNSEVIDNVSKYLEITCNKVNIWSLYDQIIKNPASLKTCLQAKISQQPFKQIFGESSGKISPKDQIDELVQPEVINNPVYQNKKNLHNHAESFALHMIKLIETCEDEYYLLTEELNKIDGAGHFLPSSIKPVIRYDQKFLKKIHKDYYLGLLVYGPKLNVISNAQFENLIQKILKVFNNSSRITLQNLEIKKIIDCLIYAKDILSKKILAKKFGEVIVTQQGHNDQLKKTNYRQLESIIHRSIANQ